MEHNTDTTHPTETPTEPIAEAESSIFGGAFGFISPPTEPAKPAEDSKDDQNNG